MPGHPVPRPLPCRGSSWSAAASPACAAAAWLRRAAPRRGVTVLEGSPRVGGKLALGEVGGRDRRRRRRGDARPPPRGAWRWPAASGLDAARAPGDRHGAAVDPRADAPAAAHADGRARRPRRWPRRGALRAGAGPRGAGRGAAAPRARRTTTSASAAWSSERLGQEVVDRLVEPLLGGVYAGHARELSARAAVPAAASRCWTAAVAARGAAARRPTRATADGPVFAGLPGGSVGCRPRWSRAPGSPSAPRPRCARSRTPRTAAGSLVVGSAPRPAAVERRRASCSPPRPRRPPGCSPRSRRRPLRAARDRVRLDGDRHAGVPARGPARRVRRLRVPRAAGRRPRGQGRDLLLRQVGLGAREAGRRDLLLLRCSIGRHREERRAAGAPTRSWSSLALADLADAVGLCVRPVDAHVQRWGGGLPQYAVGHLDRVARSAPAVAELPGLAVCGAAYDGRRHPGLHRLRPQLGGRPGAGTGAARPRAPRLALREENRCMTEAAHRPASARPATSTSTIRYTMWSVFRLREPLRRRRPGRARPTEVEKLFAELAGDGRRGARAVRRAGLRADADLMVWWHADDLRRAAGGLPPASAAPRSAAGSSRSGRRWRCTGRRSSTRATSRRSSPTRSRAATSASTRSCAPTTGTCSRTPSAAGMLAEHGKMAREYPDVRANTVAVVRARRLRVDPRLRGRRAAPDRRPDAPPARLGGPPARARGGAVLHRARASELLADLPELG